MDIVSFTDSNYSTIKRREGRAVCGLSMGGGHTFGISMLYPDTFDYYGLFSAAPWIKGNRPQRLRRKAESRQGDVRKASEALRLPPKALLDSHRQGRLPVRTEQGPAPVFRRERLQIRILRERRRTHLAQLENISEHVRADDIQGHVAALPRVRTRTKGTRRQMKASHAGDMLQCIIMR